MLQVFEGTYTEYKESQLINSDISKVALVRETSFRKERAYSPSTDEKKRSQKIREVETKIAALESEIAQISSQLENPPADIARVQKLGTSYTLNQAALEQLMTEWESLQKEKLASSFAYRE